MAKLLTETNCNCNRNWKKLDAKDVLPNINRTQAAALPSPPSSNGMVPSAGAWRYFQRSNTSSMWIWHESVQWFPRYLIHTQTKKRKKFTNSAKSRSLRSLLCAVIKQLTNRKILVTEKFLDVHIWPYFAGNVPIMLNGRFQCAKFIYLFTSVATCSQPSWNCMLFTLHYSIPFHSIAFHSIPFHSTPCRVKAELAHSVCGQQVKLCDPSLTCATPERFVVSQTH